MAMRISGSTMRSTGISHWQKRQQDFKDLYSALNSGDLANAQKAYANLTGGAKAVNSSNPLAQLGQALQSGDLAGARAAANQLQSRHARLPMEMQNQTPPDTSASAKSGGLGSLLDVHA